MMLGCAAAVALITPGHCKLAGGEAGVAYLRMQLIITSARVAMMPGKNCTP
jgi:hypothetical protein